jgi:hypothetical protein
MSEVVGGPGVKVFGHGTLTGLAARLPSKVVGGKVKNGVKDVLVRVSAGVGCSLPARVGSRRGPHPSGAV